MESNDTLKPNHGKSIWLRTAALLMALLMVCSILLLDAIKIKIRRQADDEPSVFSTANNYLVDSTEYISQSTLERAAKAIEGALTKPVSLQDFYDLASEAIAKEKYSDAMTFIDACLEIAASDEIRVEDRVYVDLLMKKACLLALLGNYDEALEFFDKVLQKDPGQAQAYQVKIQICFEQGKIAEAVEALRQYLNLKPLDFKMRLALIQLLYTQQEFESAESECTTYLSQTKQAAGTVYFLRGACRMQTANYQGAKEDMLLAAQNGYEDPALCYGQAAICAYLLKQTEDVITYGQMAVEIGSKELDSGFIRSYMGYACMLLNRFEEAYGHFTYAIELGQPKGSMLYYRGVSLMAQDKPEEAIAEFTEALAEGETTSQCYYNRAVCRLKLRQYDTALEDLKKVVAMYDNPELKADAEELIAKLTKS